MGYSETADPPPPLSFAAIAGGAPKAPKPSRGGAGRIGAIAKSTILLGDTLSLYGVHLSAFRTNIEHNLAPVNSGFRGRPRKALLTAALACFSLWLRCLTGEAAGDGVARLRLPCSRTYDPVISESPRTWAAKSLRSMDSFQSMPQKLLRSLLRKFQLPDMKTSLEQRLQRD